MSMLTNGETTDSGLQYFTIKEGHGETPLPGQTVLVHYELWLGEGSSTSNYENEEYIDELYDSTYDTRNPFHGPIPVIIGKHTPKDDTYTLGDSIPGFDEALVRMKLGGKVQLLIPSHLGYGELGGSSFHTFHGYRTAPNKSIKCNIELVEIKSNT